MKKLAIFLNLILIMAFLSGCSDNTNNKKDKAIQEIDYLDSEIITMINRLNNITFENYIVDSNQTKSVENPQGTTKNNEQQANTGGNLNDNTKNQDTVFKTTQMSPDTILISSNNNIEWSDLKSKVEILNSSWGVIILDLYSMNIKSENILAFSTVLDNCIINIKNEDKKNTLINLAKLYSLIPEYISDIPDETNRKNIKQTKSYIVNAYSLVEQKKWNEISKNIEEAENTFKNIINDIEYVKNNNFKVNKTYILLKELQNSISFQDDKIFYIKYKNLMENLNSMQS